MTEETISKTKIHQGDSENLSKYKQVHEEPQDMPENISEDSLIDILPVIRSRTSSTETIVPETQETNESFLFQTPCHYRRTRRKKTLKMKTMASYIYI